MKITLIAAVGKSGQVGLNGKLPWPHNAEDMRRFREMTTGGVVIVGHNTWGSVKHLNLTYGRYFARDGLIVSPRLFISTRELLSPERNIWIAGGPKTWARWAPFITHMDITRIDYDGPADTWFPWQEFGVSNG